VIVGGHGDRYGITVDLDQKSIHETNEKFWNTKGNDVIGCLALPLYGAFISEEKCQLLGNLTDKKVLDICCGTGHSLLYVGEKNASELWGVDLSQDQLVKANDLLIEHDLKANLICSPMEKDCGLPSNYFDTVYSVYGIGWTTDLEGTFNRIASYLKKDGSFIFSWSHPIHKCVSVDHDDLRFKKNYFDESWYVVNLGGEAISLSDRKMSTYINALSKAGFIIEEMIEESHEDLLEASDSVFAKKAEMLPVTFVIKSRKI
jgi:ubiquinone/menaquinone biosynthesis C-methylase UbiE